MSSGLRRSKAVKYHRTPPSSETSAGPSEPSQAQYKNPQSSTATSRHTAPDEVTEAESHAVLSGKLPANRGELNQRRKAVCYVDFNSSIDHEPICPTRAALHALKLRTDELMSQMYHDCISYGHSMDEDSLVARDASRHMNTNMRIVLDMEHQLCTEADADPKSKKTAMIKSSIADFENRYQDFATNLRAPSRIGENDETWMTRHAEKSLELCRSARKMVSFIPKIYRPTVEKDQSLLRPLSSSASIGPSDLHVLSEDDVEKAEPVPSDEWVPSPISVNDQGSDAASFLVSPVGGGRFDFFGA